MTQPGHPKEAMSRDLAAGHNTTHGVASISAPAQCSTGGSHQVTIGLEAAGAARVIVPSQYWKNGPRLWSNGRRFLARTVSRWSVTGSEQLAYTFNIPNHLLFVKVCPI